MAVHCTGFSDGPVWLTFVSFFFLLLFLFPNVYSPNALFSTSRTLRAASLSKTLLYVLLMHKRDVHNFNEPSSFILSLSDTPTQYFMRNLKKMPTPTSYSLCCSLPLLMFLVSSFLWLYPHPDCCSLRCEDITNVLGGKITPLKFELKL